MKNCCCFGEIGPWQSKCQVVQFVIVLKLYSIKLSISASVYQISILQLQLLSIIITKYQVTWEKINCV